MAHRVMELTLVSASDLKDVNTFSDMAVYAVATVSSDPLTRRRTRTDRCGGTDPSWDDDAHRFVVPPTAGAAAASGASLRVLLRTERFFGDDRDVGEVIVPLADMLAAGASAASGTTRCVSYKALPCGVLRVSYRLSPVVAPLPKPAPGHRDGNDDPYYYRQSMPPSYYHYPHPQYYGGYPAPSYIQGERPEYPPPLPPYARTPEPKKKNNGGNFFGLGGIGGMLFGDMGQLPLSTAANDGFQKRCTTLY